MAKKRESPPIKRLHLSGGEKGGVGKSFTVRTLGQFFLDAHLPFRAVECDRSNPDFARIYGQIIDVQFAIISEGQQYEDDANLIYNLALEGRVLANLPAQVMPSLKAWLNNLDLLSLAEEDGVKFIHWFTVDGGYDSLSLLRKSLELFQNKPAWATVIVLNHGTGGDDFSGFFEDADLQALIQDTQSPVIHLPRFQGASTRNRIDRESLTFGQALTHKGFTSIERQRVRKYLREAYALIEQVKAWL
ncbi:MAG: hypothetical protein F6J97_18955 [Leptolyngbya sp. SIO4C1]|nr:hypothetical protein [Leptolyngbya sp. SIO4C1]